MAAHATISATLGRDNSAYHIKIQRDSHRLDNPAQQLNAAVRPAGVHVQHGATQWDLSMLAWGYGDTLRPVGAAVATTEDNRVEYRRGALTEWYVNGPAGVQQGFTIDRAPLRRRGPLTVALRTAAPVTVDADRRGLTVLGTDRNALLRYAGLTVYDADQRELPAWIEAAGECLWLRVDDASARYPLVIDPVIQLAKLTASDGAAGDLFGWAVAISGDTVVVGARSDAIGANIDQGSAYVFGISVCGNTVTEAGEQCDDGNVLNGDCCSSTCQYESIGSACTDGLYCTGTDTCNNSGLCSQHSGDPCPGPDGDGNCAESCTDVLGGSCTANDPNGALCTGGTCNAGVCSTATPLPAPPPDNDGDGVPNGNDNCAAIANPDQADADRDRVGDICDTAPEVFNADQSDGNGNDVADVVDSGTPPSLTVQRVLLRANTSGTDFGNGRLTVRGQFDTTELGGVGGLRDALRQGFAVGVSGAGMSETQALFFPPCVAVAVCDGSNGESASFIRKRNSDVFTLRIVANQRSFGPPLSSAPVTAVLSLGGLDRRDDTSACRVRTRGVSAGCR